MICPRCDSEKVELLTKAPKDNAWEVYICKECNFSWRSTEGDDITNPEKYDERFKINRRDIGSFPVMPPIPRLLKDEK